MRHPVSLWLELRVSRAVRVALSKLGRCHALAFWDLGPCLGAG